MLEYDDFSVVWWCNVLETVDDDVRGMIEGREVIRRGVLNDAVGNRRGVGEDVDKVASELVVVVGEFVGAEAVLMGKRVLIRGACGDAIDPLAHTTLDGSSFIWKREKKKEKKKDK